jgi:hypothetical protein
VRTILLRSILIGLVVSVVGSMLAHSTNKAEDFFIFFSSAAVLSTGMLVFIITTTAVVMFLFKDTTKLVEKLLATKALLLATYIDLITGCAGGWYILFTNPGGWVIPLFSMIAVICFVAFVVGKRQPQQA